MTGGKKSTFYKIYNFSKGKGHGPHSHVPFGCIEV